jgi:hypothetical protein
MKKITLILFALFCMNVLEAQVNIGGKPISYSYEKAGILEPIAFEQMPPLDFTTIEAEDAQWEAERAAGMSKIGRRFGVEFAVDYDLNNSGTWTELPDGGKLWRLGIECPGALSINLIFDQYSLPAEATLYIYSEDKSDKIGGFTDYNNQADNFFATDIVLSDKAIIEYYQPNNANSDGKLRLATIVHGYRGSSAYPKGFGESGYCQRNTICPEGEGWGDQIRSVFALYSGGMELCTGTILNNTANDKKPYALTANHCWNAAQNPGIWVFRFNWESPTCTPTTNSTYKTMSGSVLRMRTPTNTSATDACLVELNQQIPEDYGVFYAGWSRSTTAPTSGVIIHHPELDIKKITHSTNIVSVTQYVQGWRANFAVGGACTDPGSSGSPLFDQNGRVIGQEYGGLSYCGAPASSMFDVWGKFDVSWNGSLPSNRLKDWLDPLNLDPTTLDGTFGSEVQIVDAELYEIISPEALYYYANTIDPKIKLRNSGNVTITSATLSYTIDGSNPVQKIWTGNLIAGATIDFTFDAITLTYGTHVFEATVAVIGDANPANNSKTINYEVLFCREPVNISGIAEGRTAIITWDEPENLEGVLSGYNLYRNGLHINNELIIEQIYYDEDLAFGTYNYQVSALFEKCESELSEAISVTIEPQHCEKPVNLEGVGQTVKGYPVWLTWDEPENIDGILSGYNVFRNDMQINEEPLTQREFEDNVEVFGEYYYQVSAVYEHCESDRTDSVMVFVKSGISDNRADAFNLFPHPAKGEITIIYDAELQVRNEELQVEIYDAFGSKQSSHHLTTSLSHHIINVSHLPSGIYFVKIIIKSGIVTKKIVVEN